MKVFKGFGKDMKCRDFQYEEGKTYECEKAKLCKEGFHACELPLDCMNYYALNNAEYHEVELDGVTGEKSDDSKVCGTKIRIGAKLNIMDLVNAEVELIKEKVKPETGNWSHAATTGDSAHAATTGDSAHAVTTGNWSHAATTGNWSHAATTGYRSHAATTGDRSHAATTGDSSHAATTGYRSHAATTGYRSHATTTGDSSHAATTGYRSHAEANGKNAIAAALGIECRVKGAIGVWLVCAEYTDDNKYNLLCVRTARVDGESIKPDTWYTVRNGEFVEAPNE